MLGLRCRPRLEDAVPRIRLDTHVRRDEAVDGGFLLWLHRLAGGGNDQQPPVNELVVKARSTVLRVQTADLPQERDIRVRGGVAGLAETAQPAGQALASKTLLAKPGLRFHHVELLLALSGLLDRHERLLEVQPRLHD